MSLPSKLARDTRGAQLAEYLIIVAGIAILALAGLRAFGSTSSTKVESVAACIEAMSGAGCAVADPAEGGTRHKTGASAKSLVAGAPPETTPAPPEPPAPGFWAGVWNGVTQFFTGAVAGDLAGDQGVAGTAGQIGAGAIPFVGQLADIRDTGAAIGGIFNGEPGAWPNLGATLLGWIPVLGDAAKAGIRGARHIDEAAQGVVRQADELPAAARILPQTHAWGTARPALVGPPNSVYTHVDPQTGRAVQNAIYDANGNVVAHVDFKPHGAAPPGHFHIFPEPGNPASGHGPAAPHYDAALIPPGWNVLPANVQPHTLP